MHADGTARWSVMICAHPEEASRGTAHLGSAAAGAAGRGAVQLAIWPDHTLCVTETKPERQVYYSSALCA